jgi:hypothetical protein
LDSLMSKMDDNQDRYKVVKERGASNRMHYKLVNR